MIIGQVFSSTVWQKHAPLGNCNCPFSVTYRPRSLRYGTICQNIVHIAIPSVRGDKDDEWKSVRNIRLFKNRFLAGNIRQNYTSKSDHYFLQLLSPLCRRMESTKYRYKWFKSMRVTTDPHSSQIIPPLLTCTTCVLSLTLKYRSLYHSNDATTYRAAPKKTIQQYFPFFW